MDLKENNLPPYIFSVVDKLKLEKRQEGEDIIDFGLGNPDGATPKNIINKLIQKCQLPQLHRYSDSRGIKGLRRAITRWYKKRYDIQLDQESEAIVTIGSKEGIAHLALAVARKGTKVLVVSPNYPIHTYAFVIAGADIEYLPMPEGDGEFFFKCLHDCVKKSWPKPNFLLLSFPNNPTTTCVELSFFERVIAFAKANALWVIHDLAYADLIFDKNYKAPSILEVEGAKDIAVEFFTLSKSYNMPGWRVGFMVGNERLVAALSKIKSYLDYGIFTPLQLAAIEALEGDQICVENICDTYRKRRDVLCRGLNKIGWPVEPPKATMFVWAKIPEMYQHMDCVEFTKKMIHDAKVAVSPGSGFGIGGEKYVRFGLVENQHRIRQAVRLTESMMIKDGIKK